MEITEQFKQFAQKESSVFPAIMKIMCHSKKEEGRRFLSIMNNIIDYVLNNPLSEIDAINCQIIHIPSCPDWTRELLVRFTIHKAALSFNRILLDKIEKAIKKTIVLSSNPTKKEKEQIFENKYRKRVCKEFSQLTIPNNTTKSFLLVKDNDIDTKKQDKNPWLERLFSREIASKDFNVCLSTDKSAFDIENEIEIFDKQSITIPVFENIFIFHSSNRGKLTNSYNCDQLQKLNNWYDTGIKNCIIFSFSGQPFRLYHTIDNVKYRLTSTLLNKEIRKYNTFDGFITFTQKESDYLFNRENTQRTALIDAPEREYLTLDIDSFFEQIPHNYRYKNALSLAFSDDLQQKFIDEISGEIDIKPDVFVDFFNYYKYFWNENIRKQIDVFLDNLNNNQSVAMIIARETPKYVQTTLKNLFPAKIKFHSIEDLKNGIDADKIVVLQYRYTDKIYKSFPNSFDPLPLKEGQEAFVIINRLTHNNYYEWNKHRYDKDFNGLLYSTFRKENLEWSVRYYQKPILPDIRDYIDEAEFDNREYQIEKCIVHYKGNKQEKHPASKRALYVHESKYQVSQLKDLTMFESVKIQLLDEIAVQIKDLLNKKTAENSKAEEYMRRDKRYKLSEEEIISSIELWKILLKRKVDELGTEKVYNAIFPDTQEISHNGFLRWCDFEYPMFLPRSRKSQNALFKYLGFELGAPYHRIMLTKKLVNINNSRELNRQIEALLQTILTRSVVTEKDFEIIMDANFDILTLLDIRNSDDIKALVDLLEISLKTVTRIEYDQE